MTMHLFGALICFHCFLWHSSHGSGGQKFETQPEKLGRQETVVSKLPLPVPYLRFLFPFCFSFFFSSIRTEDLWCLGTQCFFSWYSIYYAYLWRLPFRSKRSWIGQRPEALARWKYCKPYRHLYVLLCALFIKSKGPHVIPCGFGWLLPIEAVREVQWISIK